MSGTQECMIASRPVQGVPQSYVEQSSAFVTRHSSFADVIGPGATLRLLFKEESGVPLFHEAGIYLAEAKSVYVSSNRISSSDEQQSICISRIPVDCLPPPPHSSGSAPRVLKPLQKSNPVAYQDLEGSLTTWTDLPNGLTMPNGATKWTVDGQDAILWCEQGRHDMHHNGVQEVPSSLVVCTEDHRTTTVLKSYKGKPFCSLNDVVVHPQSGIVFFTDPDYGVGQSFKQAPSKSNSYAPKGLYAWDPSSNEVRLLDERYDKPNGVTFVADLSDPTSGKGLLITTDTGRFSFKPNKTTGIFTVDDTRPACIYTYKVTPSSDSSLDSFPHIDVVGRELLGHSECPVPDGIHPDQLGNVWTGNGDGLHIWNPWTGKLLGKIILPSGKGVANFCWAGPVSTEDIGAGPKQEANRYQGNGLQRPMYRLLLFAEDELWEACVAVNGWD